MNRQQLEHVIRAAADVAGEDEIVVVGSQAILGQFPSAPPALLRSQEADVYPRAEPERAILVDGALGDGSVFHATFGYYAHGVGPETAKAPTGWEQRLVPVKVSKRPSRGETVIGWCLEAHDLVLSKCVAGRQRDLEFAEIALREGVVAAEILLSRVSDLPLEQDRRRSVERLVQGLCAKAARRAR